MARNPSVSRHNQRSSQVRFTPHSKKATYKQENQKCRGKLKKPSNAIEKDWEDAPCSVCMEFPHNAVLLLCSSYDKGCRPYMCGTNHRFSNCLDLFKKAYMKIGKESVGSSMSSIRPNTDISKLACPLCRGEVKGWTVVESARKYLNAKKRGCMQDNCSHRGTYKELRKHVKVDHPLAKPRRVDPVLEQNWRRIENERERRDVLSTIRSSMPGSVVMGDYVIENDVDIEYESSEGGFSYSPSPDDSHERSHESGRINEDSWFNFRLLLQSFVNRGNRDFATRLMRTRTGSRALSSFLSVTELPTESPTEEADVPHNGVENIARVARQGDIDADRAAAGRRRLRRIRRSMGLI